MRTIMATDIVDCSTNVPQPDEVSTEVTVSTDLEQTSVSSLIRSSLQAVHGSVEESPAAATVLEEDLERSFRDEDIAAAELGLDNDTEEEDGWREQQNVSRINLGMKLDDAASMHVYICTDKL